MPKNFTQKQFLVFDFLEVLIFICLFQNFNNGPKIENLPFTKLIRIIFKKHQSLTCKFFGRVEENYDTPRFCTWPVKNAEFYL